MPARDSWPGKRVYTVGHSTRPAGQFIELLKSFGIELVADIRTIPRSRRNPQFSGPQLQSDLAGEGIRYVHLPELGGLRRARKDSSNTGWRNAAFRGYADFMQTETFEEGMERLAELAEMGIVALMCAEAVPWRCHRSLVADALTVRGAEVEHITAPAKAHPHKITPFARVQGIELSYPGE